MIAGFRAGEIDVAFDLADSDIPKVQDLGEQVAAIPALLYEFLRPNWSPKADFDESIKNGGCSRNAAVQGRGEGCPTADPAIRQAIAFAIDKNEINTRLLGGNAQVANTNISPAAWFYADQPPAVYDPEKAKQILADGGWADTNGDGFVEKDGVTAKIELCTTTRQVRQDTLALVSAWLKAVGIDSIINPVAASDIFADYNEATLDTPCALSTSNFDLAEHAFSSSIDPLGNYFSYHSSQFHPDGANDARVNDPDIDKAHGRRQEQRRLRDHQGRHGDLPEGLRREDRRDPALLPQERGARRPPDRQLLRERHPGRLDLEHRGLVRQELAPDRPRHNRRGARNPGAPSYCPTPITRVGVRSAQPPGDPAGIVPCPPSRKPQG